MKRALKVLVPLVILAETVLVLSGILDPGDALVGVAVLEALLVLFGVGGLLLVVRRYRKKRRSGIDPWMAFEDGLSLALPPAVARLAVKEPRLFVCLFRWAFRRVGLADGEFAYHRRSLLRALMPLVVVSAPVELVVVHVLAVAFSPWWWLKWALLIVGVYATFWLLGLYASLVALPHALEDEGLRLRYGLMAEGFISYGEIEAAETASRKAPDQGDGLFYAPGEDALYLAAGGKTDVTLRLRAPRSMRGLLKDTEPAYLVHLAVDEPDQFVRALCERIATAVPDTAAGRVESGPPLPSGRRTA